MMEMVSTRRAQPLRRLATELPIHNRYTHTKTHTNTKPHTLTDSLTHSPTRHPTHPLTNFNAISVNEAGRFWAHAGLQKTALET
jgi:hypothetical protein